MTHGLLMSHISELFLNFLFFIFLVILQSKIILEWIHPQIILDQFCDFIRSLSRIFSQPFSESCNIFFIVFSLFFQWIHIRFPVDFGRRVLNSSFWSDVISSSSTTSISVKWLIMLTSLSFIIGVRNG